ncbi:MAG: hypothetical protein WD709_01365, partial [Gammaproteobacteria bacterium]
DMKSLAVFLMTLCFSIAASADSEFVCTMGDAERTISVVYSGDGLVPCEVRYDKGEGAEVLWSAEHTEGFCENQAREFVSRQEGWGYSCTEIMEEND